MMKRNIIKACTIATLIFAAQSSHASLITNGGFESGLAGWTCVTPGGNCGTASWGGPKEGSRHFYGYDNGPGGLSYQSFATNIGSTYSIDFFYGSSSTSPTNNLSLEVGDLAETFSFSTDDSWSSFSSTFTAISATTSLHFFFDTDGGSGTLWLDDIVVDAVVASVPEPSSIALLGLALAGLSFARRKKAA
ncbi:PEP-CTERM sorting domain-containing protein [Marinobacter fuscus]|nr:PEP-CTERM sorting domain-containing protein [Marinobacter fuscus]